MSKSVSALHGESFTGFCKVEEQGLRGMVTLRGDLSAAKLKNALKKHVGPELPAQRAIATKGAASVAWMSPDEVLIIVPYAKVAQVLDGLNKDLAKDHMLAVDVSDARAAFQISGPGAREVLAKVCPVDLSRDVFTSGEMRRTRLAQVACAFWLSGEDEFTLICFRSVAEYAMGVLKQSAAHGGEVGYF